VKTAVLILQDPRSIKMKDGQSKPTKAAGRNRVYYAHAMCLYGTLDERQELRYIRRTFRSVIVVNPAAYSDHPGKLSDTMGFCLKLISECKVPQAWERK